jgi:hypothetical protein
LNCGRDFGRKIHEDHWRAAHVGLLRIEFLSDEVTLVDERTVSNAFASRGSLLLSPPLNGERLDGRTQTDWAWKCQTTVRASLAPENSAL